MQADAMAANNGNQPTVELDLSLLRARQPLGKGAIASYWRATYDGDDVALKVSNPRLKTAGGAPSPAKAADDFQPPKPAPSAGEVHSERLLLLDAQATLVLDHRHIVRCFGVAQLPEGTLPGQTGPALAAALELCEPYALKDLLTRSMAAGKRLFKIRQAYDWLLQVASALAHLHGLKVPIIHRDVKPDTVLLKREPNGDLICKLSDFGLHLEMPYERSGELAGAATGAMNSPARVPTPSACAREGNAILLENPCFMTEDRSNRSQQHLSTVSVASSDVPSTSGALAMHSYPTMPYSAVPDAAALGPRTEARPANLRTSTAGAVAEGVESPSPAAAAAAATATAGAAAAAAAPASPRSVAAVATAAAAAGEVERGAPSGEGFPAEARDADRAGSGPASPSSFTVVDNKMCRTSSGLKKKKSGATQQDEGLASLGVLMSQLPNGARVRDVLRRLAGYDITPLSRSEVEAFHGLKGNVGSYMYTAPEVFRKQPYNEKSDVFSFGVLSYELLSCELLVVSIFNTARAAKLGVRDPQGYASLVARGYRPPRIQKLSDAAWALIEACWHQDPVERPSMATVVVELQRLKGELGDLGLSPGADTQCVIS